MNGSSASRRRHHGLAVLFLGCLGAACGPSPADLCAHMERLAKQEAKQGTPELDDARCEAVLARKQEQIGSAAWSQKAGCMLEAKTLAELDAC